MYIAYISVSKPTPWAVAGPHGQLASKRILLPQYFPEYKLLHDILGRSPAGLHSQKKMFNRCVVSTYTEILAFQDHWRLLRENVCRKSSACHLWWKVHIDTIFFC